MAAKRKRNPDGTFVVGKVLSAGERLEKSRVRQAEWRAANPDKYLEIAAREREKHRAR